MLGSLFVKSDTGSDAMARNAYEFSFETLTGDTLNLSTLRGKVLLVVNTASKCGFTGQYEGLEKLFVTYKGRGLVVIGVPSNDFGAQEPGSNAQIAEFCQLNYGVTFPMMAKQAVTGKAAHPFFPWVRGVLGFGSAPKWNFHKYLIDAEGKPVAFYTSLTGPESGKLTRAIEKLLPGAPP